MDYEKKIREYMNSSKLYKDILSILFPELAESEDERIRKELIKVFSNREKYLIDQSFGDITVSEALAWLEKQGEQKPWSEEDKDFMYNTLSNLTELKDRYGEGYGNVGGCIDWLKSLKQRIGG